MNAKSSKVQVFALLAVACAIVGLTVGVTTSGAVEPAPLDRAERSPVAQYEILKTDGLEIKIGANPLKLIPEQTVAAATTPTPEPNS